MLTGLIANLSILTASLFFFDQIHKRFGTDKIPVSRYRILIGVMHGVAAVVLMFFSVRVNESTIFDLRNLMVISSASFGGIYSSVITAVIVIFGRVAFFGGISPSSVVASVSVSLLAIGTGLIMSSAMGYWKRWAASLAIACVLLSGVIYYLFGSESLAYIPVLLSVILLGGLFVAALTAYFANSNKVLRELKESERRYRALHSFQESIFQSASGISIIVTDTEGKVTHFNRGAELMTGYAAEEMLGAVHPYPFHDFEEIERRKGQLAEEFGCPFTAFETFVHHARTGAADERESTYVRKDGSRITVNLVVTAVLVDDEVVGFMGTATDITERKKAEQALRQANAILQELSFMDGLTGIPNRRHFDEVLDNEWKRSVRVGSGAGLSLILFDIDFFKKYNDTYGHQMGDDCLKRVASVLRKTAGRAADTTARYGGEEFAVILPDTDAAGACLLAEKLRAAIVREAIPHAGSKVSEFVTISVGTATVIPSPDGSPEKLIAEADNALYQAKASGRNRVKSGEEPQMKNYRVV